MLGNHLYILYQVKVTQLACELATSVDCSAKCDLGFLEPPFKTETEKVRQKETHETLEIGPLPLKIQLLTNHDSRHINSLWTCATVKIPSQYIYIHCV